MCFLRFLFMLLLKKTCSLKRRNHFEFGANKSKKKQQKFVRIHSYLVYDLWKKKQLATFLLSFSLLFFSLFCCCKKSYLHIFFQRIIISCMSYRTILIGADCLKWNEFFRLKTQIEYQIKNPQNLHHFFEFFFNFISFWDELSRKRETLEEKSEENRVIWRFFVRFANYENFSALNISTLIRFSFKF